MVSVLLGLPASRVETRVVDYSFMKYHYESVNWKYLEGMIKLMIFSKDEKELNIFIPCVERACRRA